ncbi:MAG TPA: hypothetical protein VM692_05255 [Gammaproteobacteria bacterium]|nr:hypothetical protein [Gammaproteobacteria bacterium]
MDKWEFFQDAAGLWRWRCTSADGHRVFNSKRSHPSRAHAVAEATTRGYGDEGVQADLDETSVTLQALRLDNDAP